MDEPPKRKRGRPPGVKNRPKEVIEAEKAAEKGAWSSPVSTVPFEDYRHPDPMAMVSRQYAAVDWAQQALQNALKTGIGDRGAKGLDVFEGDMDRLVAAGNALEKALSSHKRAIDLMKHIQGEKTPEELLEIAIRKIEGQSLITLSAVIRRLRNTRKSRAPLIKGENFALGSDSMEQAMAEAIGDIDAD